MGRDIQTRSAVADRRESIWGDVLRGEVKTKYTSECIGGMGNHKRSCCILGCSKGASRNGAPSSRKYSAKHAAKALIDHLPEQASWDDILYELSVKQRIEQGLADIEAGHTIHHERVKAELLGNGDSTASAGSFSAITPSCTYRCIWMMT